MANTEVYKTLSAAEQRDYCFGPRVKLEEQLIKGKITAKDFMNAAN